MYDGQQSRHRGVRPVVAAPRVVAVRPLAVTGKLLAPVIARVAVGRLVASVFPDLCQGWLAGVESGRLLRPANRPVSGSSVLG